MAKHDERKDVKLLSRLTKVDESQKVIKVARDSNLGIHAWGKIDFLTHYCGYFLLWDDNATVIRQPNDESNNNKSKKNKEIKSKVKTKKQ